MPAGEIADVLKYSQRNGVQFISISSQDVPTPLNDMLLGNTTALPASLELLHEETNGTAVGRLFALKSTENVISSNLHL